MGKGSGIAAALVALVFLAGCVGDQANRQSNNFGAGVPFSKYATRGEAVPADLANPPAAPAAPAPDYATRAEVAQSQNATQNSITGLGVQLGKVGEHVEGVHAELNQRMDATVATTATANAQLRAELSATINQQATINAKATADLRAEFEAKLTAQALAMAQIQAAAVAGVGNHTESSQSTAASTAGRDSTQISFTPSMAEMFERMMDKFCEMTRAEMHTLGWCITGISASFAGVMTALSEARGRRVEKSSAAREEHHRAILAHVLGTPADGKTPTTRLSAIKART